MNTEIALPALLDIESIIEEEIKQNVVDRADRQAMAKQPNNH